MMSRTDSDPRIPVAVLGATGVVGQRLIQRLSGHPWFELTEVVGSDRRVGAPFGSEVDWVVSDAPPEECRHLMLTTAEGLRSPVVLSALPSGPAARIEPALAAAGHLVSSNASAHRMDEFVPLVIPEVNADALDGVRSQEWADKGGALVTNPNCVVTGLAVALAPIERAWGIESGAVVTLQALSGAGLSGPTALMMSGNVVPWIAGEEEKISIELNKVLGTDVRLAVAVNRVPVVDGHLAHVFLNLKRSATPIQIATALGDFRPDADVSGLPGIPHRPLVVRQEVDRPQPRRDAQAGDGMTVSVGRVRAAPPYDIALTVVAHNAIRGAAGACIVNAELCVARGIGVSLLRTPHEVSSSGPCQSRP